mmetsp:Transcript_11988/g.25885  ORF Transcript_11988/g.25885 Transcript_11988/m.25885 type:complete len:166 (-) Transcript_11988:144-641(-)
MKLFSALLLASYYYAPQTNGQATPRRQYSDEYNVKIGRMDRRKTKKNPLPLNGPARFLQGNPAPTPSPSERPSERPSQSPSKSKSQSSIDSSPERCSDIRTRKACTKKENCTYNDKHQTCRLYTSCSQIKKKNSCIKEKNCKYQNKKGRCRPKRQRKKGKRGVFE